MFEYTITELKGLWSALKDMKKVVKPELRNEIDNHITEIKQVIAILASTPLRIKQAHDQKEQEIIEIISEDQSRKFATSLTKGHQE